MFTHLHGHSTFSFLEAIGSPKQIIDKAKKLGMTSIAITDYHGTHNAVNFYMKAQEEGIKPIIGLETGFVLDVDNFQDFKKIGNIVLLAYNKTGYYNLLRLTSFCHMEGLEGIPKITLDALKHNHEGLIVFMGGLESWIGKKIYFDENQDKIIEILNMLKNIFGIENIFLEIIAQSHIEINGLEKINNKIIEISNLTQIECITNNNFHYINDDDKDAREMALAIKDGLKMYDDHRRKPAGQYHIANKEEIIKTLEQNGYNNNLIRRRISNNNIISDKINIQIDLFQSLFPNYQTPKNMEELYINNKDKLIEK